MHTRALLARLLALVVAIGAMSLGWSAAPAQAAESSAAAVISGSVVDSETGEGIPDVDLEFYDDADVYEYVVTDENGAYTVELPPGTYDVDLYAAGYDGSSEVVTVTETTTTLPAFELDVMRELVTVTGSVVAADSGAGLGEAVVEAAGVDYSDDAYTEEDGSYTLDLAVGSYDLSASAEGYQDAHRTVEVTESTTSFAPLELDALEPGIYVSVSDETFGGPAEGAQVSLGPEAGGTATVRTADADGEVSFTGLASGEYRVEVVASEGFQPVEDPTTVDYAAGQIEYVDLSAEVDLTCTPGSVKQGLTNMGFENGLDSWTLGYQTESIQAVGADSFTSPWEGSKMARLGSSQPSAGEDQPQGPNIMCQDFTVNDPVETFAFNAFTYDYTGYDEFRFDVIVTDPDSGETLASYEQGAWGEGTDLKTSGWRGVELDLADQVGDTVRLSFRAGGTQDNLYAFWAYVDSAATLPPTIETDVSDVETETGSVTTDPTTGQVTVSMPFSAPSDITMSVPAECSDSETAPTSVELLLGGESFEGAGSGDGTFTATIPAESVESGPLSVQIACEGETTLVVPIGQIVLYDPSGIVSDTATGEPVVGAEVTLFKVPGWTPRDASGPHPANSCETNLSKEPGAEWSQPAPTNLGVQVNAASPEISPHVNPFITNSIGYYGWDVAEGCWYVTVEKDGYQTRTSPVVGVPTAVTDLDLQLLRVAPVNTTKPSVTGTAAMGGTLSAVDGVWNVGGLAFSYQWLRGGTPIAGATGKTYSITPTDVGQQLTVRVTATKAGYADGVATSDPSGAVAKGTITATKPKITGKTKVGKKLTAKPGASTPSTTTVKYQWLRNGKAIKKATKNKYKLTKKDKGKKISVKVTRTATGYDTLVQKSAQTKKIKG